MGTIIGSKNGFRYRIYTNDHYPPHIHVENLNGKGFGKFYLDNGEMFEGTILFGRTDIKKTITKELKLKELKEEWNKCNPDLTYEGWEAQGSWRK